MVAKRWAFVLALDRQTLYDISSVSSGQSWSMKSYVPCLGLGLILRLTMSIRTALLQH